MADQIFQVNSSSFQDVEVLSSLRAGPGIVVDFTQASKVTGSFSGAGHDLTNISASYIVPDQNTTASWAISASWATSNFSRYANSASWASSSISASYAQSSSLADSASFLNPDAFNNLILPLEYKYKNSTTFSDPSNGFFKYDNLVSSSISNVYISNVTNGGNCLDTCKHPRDLYGVPSSVAMPRWRIFLRFFP